MTVKTWYSMGTGDLGIDVVRFDRPDPHDPGSYEPLFIAVDLTVNEAATLADKLTALIPHSNK